MGEMVERSEKTDFRFVKNYVKRTFYSLFLPEKAEDVIVSVICFKLEEDIYHSGERDNLLIYGNDEEYVKTFLETFNKNTQQEIPDVLTFLDMYRAGSVEDLGILARWRANKSFNSIEVPIGMCAGAVPCMFDVHEKAYGPHGLVAGTTGSGKSEMLMTCTGDLCTILILPVR